MPCPGLVVTLRNLCGTPDARHGLRQALRSRETRGELLRYPLAMSELIDGRWADPEELSVFPPNCPHCLAQMEPGDDGWLCESGCGDANHLPDPLGA